MLLPLYLIVHVIADVIAKVVDGIPMMDVDWQML